MPVTFDQTLQYAQTQKETAPVYIHDQASTVDGQSQTQGLAKLFGSEKAANRATIRAFLSSVTEAYPGAGREALSAVKAMLSERLAQSQPLSAGNIRDVHTFMNIDKAGAAAHEMEAGGQLPAGHASAFAQFAGMHGFPLGTPAERGKALKQYILQKIVPRDGRALQQITGYGERDAPLTKLAARLNAPLDGPDGFYSQQLDAMLQGGPEHFSFQAFTHCMTAAIADIANIAVTLSPGTISNLPAQMEHEFIATLKLALPQLQGSEPDLLTESLINRELPLDIQAAQVKAVKGFMADVLAKEACTPIMDRMHLPANLADAFGRNPEVLRAVDRMLADTPGVPTREQMSDALQKATAAFCTEHSGQIAELVSMSRNPPAELTPLLSEATLPLYLNTLLVGDAVLDPLFSGGGPIDSGFMGKLHDYVDALNAGSHFTEGSFGADDAAQLAKNSVLLLLALRGVESARYPDVMSRAMSIFGRLSSELATLSKLSESMDFQRDAMTMIRILERHGTGLLQSMPRAAQAAFGASLPTEPETPAELAEQKKLEEHFIQEVFEQDMSSIGISAAVREFAEGYGAVSADIPEGLQMSDAFLSDEQARLTQSAQGVRDSVAASLFTPDGSPSELFRELSAEAGTAVHLRGVELSPIAGGLKTILADALNTATQRIVREQMRPPEVPELREVIFDTLQANLVAREALAPLLTETGEPSAVLRQLYIAAGETVDLTGMDPDLFAGNISETVLPRALTEAVARAIEKGRIPDRTELHAMLSSVLPRELATLRQTLDGIDALQESSRELRYIEDGKYTSEEKALMKSMAQKYGMRDPSLLCQLARETRTTSDLKGLCHAFPRGEVLSGNLSRLAGRFLQAQKSVAKSPQPRGMEGLMACYLDMSIRQAGFTPAQVQGLDDMLHSELARGVAHAFLFAADSPGVPEGQIPRLKMVPSIMNGLRMLTEARIHGLGVPDPAYYTANPGVHSVREMPEGVAHQLRISAGDAVVSELDEALSKHVPPLSEAAWTELKQVHEVLSQSLGDFPRPEMLPLLLMASADDIMAARQAAGASLTPEQLWDVLLGGPMPQDVDLSNLGEKLFTTALTRYRTLVRQTIPDESGMDIATNFGLGLQQSLPVKKLMELTGPGARLSLADLHWDMNLSSLKDYTPENAYGFMMDFPRADPSSVMHFETAEGEGLEISPFDISEQERSPDHPLFQQVLHTVDSMTQSEGQKARVMQTFTQAPLVSARFMSCLFPGAGYSEHGSFTVNARQMRNGDVVVDISSDPAVPLRFEEQFLIHPDGTHACTRFEMYRPPAGE